jgi:hypothetical protein
VICLLADDRAIGTAGLHGIDEVNGSAEFGIAIGEKDEWDKGYGTDALRAICDYGFGALRLERVSLMVYAGNARGRRAYEKAGFTMEGTLRHAHFAGGSHEDVHVMSLLRGEWDAMPRASSREADDGPAGAPRQPGRLTGQGARACRSAPRRSYRSGPPIRLRDERLAGADVRLGRGGREQTVVKV